jgi:hypothetical protein
MASRLLGIALWQFVSLEEEEFLLLALALFLRGSLLFFFWRLFFFGMGPWVLLLDLEDPESSKLLESLMKLLELGLEGGFCLFDFQVLRLSWDEDSLSFRIDFVLDNLDLCLLGDFFSWNLGQAPGDFDEDFSLLSWEELELELSPGGLQRGSCLPSFLLPPLSFLSFYRISILQETSFLGTWNGLREISKRISCCSLGKSWSLSRHSSGTLRGGPSGRGAWDCF